jgi:hypothetical protein
MGCDCRQNWRNWKNKPVWFSDHFNRRRFNGKPDDIQERSRLPSHQIHRKRTPTRDLHDDRSLARSTSPKDNSSKQNEAPSTSSRDVTLKLKRNREDVDIAQYTVKKRLSGAADRSSEQPEVAVLGASPATLTLSRRSINHTARVKMMKNESQRIFQCSYCPCSYMDRTGLYRHTIRLHPEKRKNDAKSVAPAAKGSAILDNPHEDHNKTK